MICTFCGTENPHENRFCGMCGVRLERRKLERRTEQRGSTACPDCGHANESKYKFCGMCGAKVDRRTQERRAAAQPVRANAIANGQLPAPESRRAATRHEPENSRTSTMTLTIPLSTNEEQSPRSSARAHEPQPVSSSVSGPSFLGLNDSPADTDYLFEEERSSHRGLRALLLLIVLAAIVGLIFVQYRSSLNKGPSSPQPPNPNPATIPQSEGRSRSPAQDNGQKTAVAAHNLQPAVATLAKAANSGLNAVSSKNSQEDDPPDNQTAQSKPDPAADTVNDQPSPMLVKARQYIHGEGRRQNCEQGLIYLRAATRENDPQAAVQMGALYSSGLCVTQDRVKAYQWFSTARDMQPDNRWISKNLNELWAQMSPQERREIHQ